MYPRTSFQEGAVNLLNKQEVQEVVIVLHPHDGGGGEGVILYGGGYEPKTNAVQTEGRSPVSKWEEVEEWNN